MRFELKLNKISMDVAGVKNAMLPYLRKALDVAEEKLIELMKQAIDETSTAPSKWRDSLKEDLKHVSDEVLNNQIKYSTGVEYAEGSGAWMRAMVIAYGMGIYGLTGQMIWAGPYGRTVWDNDLEKKKPSEVTREHELYESWQHAGGWFIHNAMSNMEAIYKTTIESELRNMPASVFSSNIKVTGR